ncbi:hypothetical protein ACFB49_28310 [Sphingomonas sp. DBB INV C78]
MIGVGRAIPCWKSRVPTAARLSGHAVGGRAAIAGPLIDFHASRDILADRDGHYGRCPFGICGLDQMPMQASLPLFD